MFNHIVFFWLKAGTSEAAKAQLLEDCLRYLGQLPSVASFSAGYPAPTARAVVDNTYAVGIAVTFTDKAGHDAYQEHPRHAEFIQRNQANWERVLVYDFIS